MSVRELFDFITDQSITDEKMDMALEAAMEKAVIRSYTGMLEQEKIDEEVRLHLLFMSSLCIL